MSDVIRINKRFRNLKAFIPSADDLLGENIDEHEAQSFKNELKTSYEKGYNEGYEIAKSELEEEYRNQLISKSEEFYNILSSFEDKLSSYESAFDRIIIDVTKQVVSKILQREIQSETIIENTLKSSISKVLGANEILIKLNPMDYELLVRENKTNSFENNFSKIKFEQNENIEVGGCYIETEIGNIDARISSQLSEIITRLETNLLTQTD